MLCFTFRSLFRGYWNYLSSLKSDSIVFFHLLSAIYRLNLNNCSHVFAMLQKATRSNVCVSLFPEQQLKQIALLRSAPPANSTFGTGGCYKQGQSTPTSLGSTTSQTLRTASVAYLPRLGSPAVPTDAPNSQSTPKCIVLLPTQTLYTVCTCVCIYRTTRMS